MSSAIRIMIAEDHTLVRTGLRLLIETQSDMTVVAEAANGSEALNMARISQPDVVVLDLSMPIRGGFEFLQDIRQLATPPKVVVLTANKDRSYAQKVFGLGGAGYVHKQSAAEDLVLAIRTVARGHRFVPACLENAASIAESSGRSRIPEKPAAQLSEREEAVLRMIAEGSTNKEIAASLDLSIKTVETYKARAMQKLDLSGRAAIVRFALQQGWLKEDSGNL